MASTTPSRPSVRPSSRQSSESQHLGTTSASSSVTAPSPSSRADQVIYRVYVKTVGVLVEGRLTHYGNGPKGEERKKDKWFNLNVPEVDLHKSDLHVYRSVSAYPPSPPTPGSDPCNVPPLLVAFILDTSDLKNGQALMWNREGGKVSIDTSLLGKGKGKEKERKTGIVLERWTFRAKVPELGQASSSRLPAHTAYRLGIIHFRALFSLIRLLPAYRLFRRLRRGNNGLRMGIKLWGPEGYRNSRAGLAEAWDVMERDLVGLGTSLDEFVPSEQLPAEQRERYDFPALDLFGTEYSLGVEYRPEVDFHVEDMETVLSEKFIDMDEDWFTPTVARHRAEEEAKATRRISVPDGMPSNSPIPPRQQAAALGSFGSVRGASISRPGGSRVPSGAAPGTSAPGVKADAGSAGTARWSALAEGLPFAGGFSTPGIENSLKEPPSPNSLNQTSGARVVARRLSSHSIHPFTMSASPSTSLLRSTPPPNPSTAQTSLNRPSSIGRTSSFLSQSGRSFTHAQIANMYGDSPSPIVTGHMSGDGLPGSSSPPVHTPGGSPSSLSFTKQPILRSLSGRPPFTTSLTSSPFIPGSLERDGSTIPSPSYAAPQIIKRYSSSLSQRQSRPTGSTGTGGQPGQTASPNSGDGNSLPGSVNLPGQGLGLSRRIASQESGLRHSLDGRSEGSKGPDDEEIQAFLKTLDALPQPPSLAALGAQASRSHLPSTSSSLSVPSVPASPSPMHGSASSSGASIRDARTPMTKAQVDDTLRRMAGDFNLKSIRVAEPGPTLQQPAPRPIASSSGPSSVGLLTASRPASAARRVSGTADVDPSPSRPSFRRQTSGSSPLATRPGATHINSQSPLSAINPPLSNEATRPPTARSLPGPPALLADDTPFPHSAAGLNPLSPQTTGGTSTATNESSSTRTSRRGPVLLRGGFGEREQRPSSSPSHSPIRQRVMSERVEDEPGVGSRPVPGRESRTGAAPVSVGTGFGFGVGRRQPGQRTAPGSLGAEGDGEVRERVRGREGRVVNEGERETDERLNTLGGDW